MAANPLGMTDTVHDGCPPRGGPRRARPSPEKEDPVRRDCRPYFVKRAYVKLQEQYVARFLSPQLDALGPGFTFMKPWHVKVFGSPISLGDYANVIATPDKPVRLTVWSDVKRCPGIRIGNYCLICPGVRISAASDISIGDNCMLASGVSITDSDWHDVYNRIAAVGKTLPVRIEDNVWIGDSTIVCKGVTIGKNSVVGAGAVVVDSVPSNVIAAGNPARIVRELDPRRPMVTRAQWFSDPRRLSAEIDGLDRDMLKGNTVLDWLRSLVYPLKSD